MIRGELLHGRWLEPEKLQDLAEQPVRPRLQIFELADEHVLAAEEPAPPFRDLRWKRAQGEFG